MKTLTITIPGQPVGKGRPRFSRATGRTYTPANTARYENLVALFFREAYPDWEPVEGEVEMTMRAYFEIPKSWPHYKKQKAIMNRIRPTKKPDTDNISKIKDALNGIAYKDDAQVVTDIVHKYYSTKPRLEVTIFIKEED